MKKKSIPWNKPLALMALLMFTLSLSACGFHLCGHEPLPPQFKILYLKSCDSYSVFTKGLRQVLVANGVQLVSCPQSAPITLQILSNNLNQQTIGVGSSGQITTYIITYMVTYQLLDNKGCMIQKPTTVSTNRNFAISSTQILGNINALDSLKVEMQRDIVFQIFSHLRHLQNCYATS